MKIAFVVLHYTALNDTIETVNSIREHIDTDDYKIIIVDNCSPDNSWNDLNKLYNADNDIVLIHNEENLGFAKGNNVGFMYAKKNFNPEYIVLSNNDINLFQNNFCSMLDQKFQSTNFAVLGPMIINGDGSINTSPMRKGIMTRQQANRAKKRYNRLLTLNKFDLDEVYKKTMSVIHKYKPSFTVAERLTETKNVEIHGCFMVFSRNYTDKFDGLDPRTFLYAEEDILFLRTQSENLTTLYCPSIAVYHKEGTSTSASNKSNRKKNAFVYKNCIKSINVYLDILDSVEKSDK